MKLRKIKTKKAAIELSIGTVVVIVLAMTMLILGLSLVRTIFSGATDSVDEINEGVKSEIKKLFQDENDKAVIRLAENTAKVKQGDDYNFAFAVRNNHESGTMSYGYEVNFVSSDSSCPSGYDFKEKWISFGSGTMNADAGKIDEKLIRLSVPEDSPTCTAQFTLNICEGTPSPSCPRSSPNLYKTLQFFVEVKSGGIF